MKKNTKLIIISICIIVISILSVVGYVTYKKQDKIDKMNQLITITNYFFMAYAKEGKKALAKCYQVTPS